MSRSKPCASRGFLSFKRRIWNERNENNAVSNPENSAETAARITRMATRNGANMINTTIMVRKTIVGKLSAEHGRPAQESEVGFFHGNIAYWPAHEKNDRIRFNRRGNQRY
ncbi:MAG: hypothetical protein WCH43_00645 [Verrucomicrobiota bacterium]